MARPKKNVDHELLRAKGKRLKEAIEISTALKGVTATDRHIEVADKLNISGNLNSKRTCLYPYFNGTREFPYYAKLAKILELRQDYVEYLDDLPTEEDVKRASRVQEELRSEEALKVLHAVGVGNTVLVWVSYDVDLRGQYEWLKKYLVDEDKQKATNIIEGRCLGRWINLRLKTAIPDDEIEMHEGITNTYYKVSYNGKTEYASPDKIGFLYNQLMSTYDNVVKNLIVPNAPSWG